MSEPTSLVRVSPRSLMRCLTWVVVAIVAVHLVLMVLRFGFGHDTVFGLVRLFDLDRESNVPTWVTCILLVLVAALLGLTGAHLARAGDRWARHWTALGWIFALMSLDEMAGIHERVGKMLAGVIHVEHWIRFVWPIPAVVLLIVLFLVYRPWFAALDRATRRGILGAAAVYLLGALGVEVVGGAYWARGGPRTLDVIYASITTVEETLEMAGLLLFVRVFLGHVAAHGPGLAIAPDGAAGASERG